MLKIVSGGQTGVDRAALDVALELGLPCGGWCPRGRRAEDGPLDRRYPLTETASADYELRTRLNVRDSQATLILHRGRLSAGTAFTQQTALELGRPLMLQELAGEPAPQAVRAWLAGLALEVLNVAGPRESGAPGIYDAARRFLRRLLAQAT